MIEHTKPAVEAIADDEFPDLPEPRKISMSDSAELYRRADAAHQAAYFTKGYAVACAISLDPERGAIAEYAREVGLPYSTVHEEFSCYSRMRRLDEDRRREVMRWISKGLISYRHVRDCLGVHDDEAFYAWLKASHDNDWRTRRLKVEQAAARASADVVEGEDYDPSDVPPPDEFFADDSEPSTMRAPRSCTRCHGTGREPEGE